MNTINDCTKRLDSKLCKLQCLFDECSKDSFDVLNLEKTTKQYIMQEMTELFRINRANEDSTNDVYKTSNDLEIERATCVCYDSDDTIHIFSNCQSIKRINIILTIYKKMMEKDLFQLISLTEVLRYGDIYTITQITDDFFHIKDHIDHNTNEKELRMKFRNQFGCTNLKSIPRRCSITEQSQQCIQLKTANTDDIVLKQECDKIFTYLTHSELIYTEQIYNSINRENTNRTNSKPYIGKIEDDKWLNYQVDDEMDEKESNENIYSQLVHNMGVFRWQSVHGFKSKQHHALMHLKPKYNNIKEEVLYNPYHSLSKDNWNQTLRKSKVFENSFARQRIKTSYDGKYDDKISGIITKWEIGETICLAEIVTFKLYDSFEKLQYELTKCFRFESTSSIIALNNFDSDEQNIRLLLEKRLQIFYWWRIKLLMVLNKYAQTLNPNVTLYHGVNAKMIINNKRMQWFSGPLSASSSYHIAQTFATAKGMVLEITSQFPRLGLCRAFDASLLSDYAEEKEQIISVAYLRIQKVLTRSFNNKHLNTIHAIDNDNCHVPLSSKIRSIFTAVHLFQQQIFSMDIQLEYWLHAFLYSRCNYDELADNNDNGQIIKTKFVDDVEGIDNYNRGQNEDTHQRYYRTLNILCHKFDNFRRHPNQKQVVKIDQISDNLKPYFMDYIGLDIYNNPAYVISFDKIIRIYENVKQIHFINKYSLDDATLNKLIQYLYEHPTSKLKIIKFLYYDYPNTSDGNSDNALNSVILDKLQTMNWDIAAKQIGQTGHEIKLFANGKKLKIQAKIEQIAYKQQYSDIKVPRILTNLLVTRILEFIPHNYSYIIKSYVLQIQNQYSNGKIKISNLALCDKSTKESLYVAAEPFKHKNYKWKIIPTIFTANDIRNRFNILEYQLPISWKICARFRKQLAIKPYIEKWLRNHQYMMNIINQTKWNNNDVIPIYNKNENTDRLPYTPETQVFRKKLIQFVRKNINKNRKLIEIVMPNKRNKGHHVEYIQIIRIKIKKNDCNIDFDIGISYQYNIIHTTLKPVGIHLDKHFILNQHQLITEYHTCDCLKNFKSTIDYLSIGNPDNDRNNVRRYKIEYEKQKKQNVDMKNRIKSKLAMNNNDDCKSDHNHSNMSVNDDEDSKLDQCTKSNVSRTLMNNTELQIKNVKLTDINNFYFQQTLNPIGIPIIPHPSHQTTKLSIINTGNFNVNERK